MDILKKLQKTDWVIIIIGIFIMAGLDYQNLSILDYVYVAAMVLWVLMLIIRLKIEHDKEKKN